VRVTAADGLTRGEMQKQHAPVRGLVCACASRRARLHVFIESVHFGAAVQ